MSLHFASALLKEGWRANVRVTFAGETIASIEVDAPPAPQDERYAVALPGMMNIHSHAFQRSMAGRAEISGASEDSFWTWRETMYALALTIDPDEFEAVAFTAFKKMLETGFTRVGEFHYLHNAIDGRRYDNPAEMAMRLISAAGRAGISLTLLPSLYRYGGFGGQVLHERQRRFALDLDSYVEVFERIRAQEANAPGLLAGLCAHSLRAVLPEDLRALESIDRKRPFHIHVAEQTAEVAGSIAHFGVRPVSWILDNAAVSPRWCFVHATHSQKNEIAGIVQRGAVVGLCPITEANLGDGIFPAVDFMALGGVWGIGSDSNIEISVGGELRLLEYGQRLTYLRRNVLAGAPGRATATNLYQAAVSGGAQALGQTAHGIAVGAPGDLIALSAPSGVTGSAALDRYVFAPDTGTSIDRVWARGRLKVREGLWTS
jgi:formimidoylglutamate deiminase